MAIDVAPLPLRRRLAYAAVLGGVALVGVGAVAEAAARLVAATGTDYALEMWHYARLLKRDSDIPGLGHAHVPGTVARLMGVAVRINTHGLREREIGYARPPGVRRVLMLGDSVTFGWGVPEEATTSRRLEAALDRGGARWQVINAGVGNYNTRMEVRYLLAEGVRYAPDVVVLNYFINDAEPDPRYRGNVLSEHLASYVFFANRLDALWRRGSGRGTWADYYAGLYAAEATGWAGARAAILELGRWCAARGVRGLVADYPELHQLAPYPFARPAALVAAAAAAAGLTYVDLRPAVADLDPASLWVSTQDAHPNGRAHARYAEALAQALAPP